MNDHDDERELTPYEREQDAKEAYGDFLRDEMRDRELEEEQREKREKRERPTPITDAALTQTWQSVNVPTNAIPAEVARNLERQLAEANEIIAMYRESKSKLPGYTTQRELAHQLAAERALADRLAAFAEDALADGAMNEDASHAARMHIAAWKEARKQP